MQISYYDLEQQFFLLSNKLEQHRQETSIAGGNIKLISKAIKIVTSEIIELFDHFMITGYPNSPLGTRIRRSYWSR